MVAGWIHVSNPVWIVAACLLVNAFSVVICDTDILVSLAEIYQSESAVLVFNGLFMVCFGISAFVVIACYIVFLRHRPLLDTMYVALGLAGASLLSQWANAVAILLWHRRNGRQKRLADGDESALLIAADGSSAASSSKAAVKRPLVGAFLMPQTYLWFAAMFVLVGCAVTFYASAGTTVVSLGRGDVEGDRIILVFQGCQIVARIANFLIKVNERWSQKISVFDVAFWVSAFLLCAFVSAASFSSSIIAFYVALAFVGLGYGFVWVLVFDLPAVSPFNVFDYGKFVAAVPNTATSLGPIAFALVSGFLYDRQADSDHQYDGSRCFFWFYVLGLGCVGFVFVSMLTKKIRSLR